MTAAINSQYKLTVYIYHACSTTPLIQVAYIQRNVSGCKNSGEETTTGIETNKSSDLISVYPVPTTQAFFIEYPSNAIVAENIRMYDLQGRQMNVAIAEIETGKAKIEVATLAKGVYLLELNDETKTIIRIVIE